MSWPAVDVMSTTSPRRDARSSGRNAFVARTVPSTFVSYIARHSSILASSTWSTPRPNPAMLSSACTGPRAPASATSRATSSSDVTSPTTGCAPVRSATSARRSARRANATTSQPRARRNRTHASPMPDDAPVTTARRGSVPVLVPVRGAGSTGWVPGVGCWSLTSATVPHRGRGRRRASHSLGRLRPGSARLPPARPGVLGWSTDHGPRTGPSGRHRICAVGPCDAR